MSQENGLLAMRFSRLNSAGLPVNNGGTVPSPEGAWAACDPVTLDLTFNYDTGTDTVQKDGAGRLCYVRKRPDNLKNATVKFEVCGGDPRELELILNGSGIVIGGETPTGFGLQNGACNTPARTGIFVEWWTENYECNAVAATAPHTRHFLPVVLANYDGGTWDETRHAFAFTGTANAGVVNPSSQPTGGGPFNDLDGFPENAGFLYGFQHTAAETAALEGLICENDYTTLPTQGGSGS